MLLCFTRFEGFLNCIEASKRCFTKSNGMSPTYTPRTQPTVKRTTHFCQRCSLVLRPISVIVLNGEYNNVIFLKTDSQPFYIPFSRFPISMQSETNGKMFAYYPLLWKNIDQLQNENFFHLSLINY